MQTKIAIVEDEEILQRVLKIQLTSVGYDIVGANDGETAIDLIQKEKPDVVILDLYIPKLDGFAVLKSIRDNPEMKETPVIVLTNTGGDIERQKAMKMGATRYFVKSASDLSQISEMIKEVL